MQIKINDNASYAITSRQYTDEGFLRVPGHVARTGVQEYLARELGLPGDPNRIVRVNRPAEEVFADESLDSYNGADITIEHPSDMVNPSTYNQSSVGTSCSKGAKDGEYVKCDLIIKSKDAIESAESGKVQLSCGYTATYSDDVPKGADYELTQRDIRINHIALVDRARAGNQARLFDEQPNIKEVNTMTKVVLDSDSGRSVEVQDTATANYIMDTIERLRTRVSDANKEIESQKATIDGLRDELTGAKKMASDSEIAKRVAEISTVKEIARKHVGDEFTCDSVSIVEIQRAALAVKRPAISWGDKSDVYVQAAFDQLEDLDDEDEDEENRRRNRRNRNNDAVVAYRQLSEDAAKMPTADTLADARAKRKVLLRDAWKTNRSVK